MSYLRLAPCAALLLVLAPASGERPEGKGGPGPLRGKPTTIALVRHGEKLAGAGDVGLAPAGKQRARRLAEVFARSPVQALFSSDLRRTAETLEPLALEKKLKTTAVKEPAELVKMLGALPAGSLAIVCHHSYTLPDILKGLGVAGSDADALDFDLHDNLILLSIHPALEARLVNLVY